MSEEDLFQPPDDDGFESFLQGQGGDGEPFDVDAPEVDTSKRRSFLEYEAKGGEVWRVEDADGYCDFYGLSRDDKESLAAFHSAVRLADEGNWMLVCRVFGLGPVMGDPVEDEGVSGVADSMGVDRRDIEARLRLGVIVWGREQMRRSGAVPKDDPVLAADDADEAMREEEVDAVLQKVGLDYLDGTDRDFAARRLRELEPYTTGVGEELVLQLVGYDLTIREVSEDLREARRSSRADKVIMEKRKHLSEVQTERLKLMKAMGVLDAAQQEGAKKRGLKQCLSDVLVAFRDHYADPENQLVDGVFSAQELELLLEPVKQRDYAYRPDVVLAAYAASAEIFNPVYKQNDLLTAKSAGILQTVWKEVLDRVNDEEEVPVKDLEQDVAESGISDSLPEAHGRAEGVGVGGDELGGVSSAPGAPKPWEADYGAASSEDLPV